MARICSEQAVEAVGNRYDLVLIAAQRTRDLQRGARPLTDKTKNSKSVIALREIEEKRLNPKHYLIKYTEQNKF